MKSQEWMASNEISLSAKQVTTNYGDGTNQSGFEVSLIYKGRKNFQNVAAECVDAIEDLFRFLAGKNIKVYGNDNSELNINCPVDIDHSDIIDYTPNA